MASRFSLFSGSDSEPLSNSCCLGQKPGMSWGLEIYTSSGPTTSHPKSSLAAAFGSYFMSTLLYSNGENFIPQFRTHSELIECCLVPSVSLRIVVWDWLFRSCAFYIHITSSWRADLEKHFLSCFIFFVFLTGIPG